MIDENFEGGAYPGTAFLFLSYSAPNEGYYAWQAYGECVIEIDYVQYRACYR
jgi:hypothetical protein